MASLTYHSISPISTPSTPTSPPIPPPRKKIEKDDEKGSYRYPVVTTGNRVVTTGNPVVAYALTTTTLHALSLSTKAKKELQNHYKHCDSHPKAQQEQQQDQASAHNNKEDNHINKKKYTKQIKRKSTCMN